MKKKILCVFLGCLCVATLTIGLAVGTRNCNGAEPDSFSQSSFIEQSPSDISSSLDDSSVEDNSGANDRTSEEISTPDEDASSEDVSIPEDLSSEEISTPDEDSSIEDVSIPKDSSNEGTSIPEDSSIEETSVPEDSSSEDINIPENSSDEVGDDSSSFKDSSSEIEHVHVWGDWYVTTSAGCEMVGEERRDCEDCDEYEIKEKAAMGHSWGEWTEISATCASNGECRRDCENCDEYEAIIISAKGHSFANYISDGNAGCLTDGTKTAACDNGCGETDTITDEGSAKGHSFGEWYVSTSATAEESGEERRDCNGCDEYQTRAIPATGHNFGEWYVEMPASCTVEGVERCDCKDCDKYETRVIPASGHSWGDWAETPAKCETDGENRRDCDNCDAFESSAISQTGHKFTNYVSDGNAGCLTNGTKTAACDNGCGEIDTVTDEGSAKGHSFGEWYVSEPATCTKGGVERRDCTDCDEYETRDTVKKGHSFTNYISDNNASCLTDGTKTAVCDNGCGETDTVTDEGSAKGHSFLEWYVSEPATCTQDGVERRDCTDCDEYETRDTVKKGHSFTNYISDNNASCLTDGTKTAVCDNGCGEANTVTDEGSAKGHAWGGWVETTPAGCEMVGEERRNCEDCDEYEIKEKAAMGHSWSEWTEISATCASNGECRRDCENCDEYEAIIISAKGHSFANYISDGNAGCLTDGTKTAVCDNGCGETDTVTDEGSAKGHAWGGWVETAPAGCETVGEERRDCSNCDEYETREILTKGHSWGSWLEIISAGCETKGEERRDCNKCEEYQTREILAQGHKYTKLKYDDVQHWYECECGEVKNGSLQNHYGGTATATVKAKCSLCGKSYGELLATNQNGIVLPGPKTYQRLSDGTVNFGAYPQTKVTDATLITALDSAAGALPTETNSKNWISYKYYIGTDKSNSGTNTTDYMWYQDIVYNGNSYRGVYFTSYRHCSTIGKITGATSYYQDDYGYYVKRTYWFAYETLNWTILEEKTGTAFLLCNNVIDSQEYYHNNSEIRTINGATVYPNNYAESNIRRWLNKIFYETAFTSLQQSLIKVTEVDNSAKSTNPYGQPTYWNKGVNDYACTNTNDKIFLLSEEEATNLDYGFKTSAQADNAKIKKASDYAKSQGVIANKSSSSNPSVAKWGLRSPIFSEMDLHKSVLTNGQTISNPVYYTYTGIVPALKLTL